MALKSNQYRILIPSEYEALLDAIEKERLRILVETLAMTGMRYTEFERFADDLSMFDAKNRAISLPAQSTKTEKERVIQLTPAFSKRLYQYLREHKALEVPTRKSMDENLKRWYWDIPEFQGMNWYPSTKTFRKTWASWLLKAGYQMSDIVLSMGHSPDILYRYYANLDPRLKSEVEQVTKLTQGWGT